ncbi:IS3 family transposase, partial [Sinomicrobium sp. M5D2P9]
HQEQLRVRNSVLEGARELRKGHPRLGCRKLYAELKPTGMGRDKTEALLLSHGFRLKRKRNRYRTTYGGKHWYPNRITDLQLTGINQLWVSDITYIAVSAKKPYYLTLILDVYSRKIKGWSLSATLTAEDTIVVAYREALATTAKTERKQLIFHSDKGSQYVYKRLAELHTENQVQPSMGGKAWENAHAESLNGILKNEYIDFDHSHISLKQGRILIKKIVEKYNYQRPHGSLKNMKPVEFETFVQGLTPEQKPRFKINY